MKSKRLIMENVNDKIPPSNKNFTKFCVPLCFSRSACGSKKARIKQPNKRKPSLATNGNTNPPAWYKALVIIGSTINPELKEVSIKEKLVATMSGNGAATIIKYLVIRDAARKPSIIRTRKARAM
ncbi:hypothetical protein TNCT_64401 [Trichonephila clavata]|uniref:Uncharacterized protein n=1 Tax=Trichonephila clavata TaxID=2740835 RepID=A0A8X6GXS6_TRICU|nr:hypothetical protein TNCT_64401 [Trichonephila clavata]